MGTRPTAATDAGSPLPLSPGSRRPKILPRENNGDECRAKSDAYKCGVFFSYLTPNREITWLGALPDALDKVEEADYKRILGQDVTKESFENINCNAATANSRCYLQMTKVTTEPMDTCGKNLLTTRAEETMGDYLCRQVKRWL